MSWLETLEEVRSTNWSEASDEERHAKADEVITISAYAGSLSAIVPIPMADMAVLLPVYTAMVMTVGHVYGRNIGEAEAKRIVLELGAVAGLAFAGHAAIGFLKRLVLPGVGGLLSIPATFAMTWATGQVAIAYFSDPELSREDLRKVFKDAVAEGKNAFSKEAFDKFREAQGGKRSEEEEKKQEPKAPPPEVDEKLKVKKRSL